jgi:hypothetical protein
LDADGTVRVTSTQTLGQRHNLCADQRFRTQPTAASCSGTLIDDDLVLTAGHCIENLSDCAGHFFVFDYLFESEGSMPSLDRDDVYRCVDLIVSGARDIPGALDLAIVQLDRPVVGRTPASFAPLGGLPLAPPADDSEPEPPREPLALGEALLMAGFPSGIPLKLDSGGRVANPRTNIGNFFVASVDAFRGNSGSGVYDASLRLVGVLTDGATDYRNVGSCQVVSVLPVTQAEEGVHYAHHAVQALCARGFPSARLCGTVAPACGDGFCSGDETSESCAADCDELFAVPDMWTCNPSWWDAGDDCDCDCGVRDPDCDDPTLDVYNCAEGSTCNEDGTCAIRVPDTWNCDDSWYNAGDDCDCGCGAPDPDCENPALRTVNCRFGGVCQADGTCTIGIPDTWTCERRDYAAADECHCGCGAWDPDCDNPFRPTVGCAPRSRCLEGGVCATPYPESWVCARSSYGSGGRCDCNCGAFDPDCATSGEAPLNCAPGDVCDAEGACAAGEVVEPDPEPAPEPTGTEPMVEPANPEPMPEPTPETMPDVDNPEPMPEPVPEEGPEPIAEPTPEVPPEADGPEPMPEAMPEAAPDADEPEPMPEAAPESEDPEPMPEEAVEAGTRSLISGGGGCQGSPAPLGLALGFSLAAVAWLRRRMLRGRS